MTRHPNTPRLTASVIRGVGNAIASRKVGEGRLCILSYHRILESIDPLLESEPDITTFRTQMALIADCFNVLPLYEAVQALRSQRLPPRAVCISFDDGYRSVHDFALPVLQEFNLPATVFVSSGFVNGGMMWNDTIIGAIRSIHLGEIDLREFGIGTFPIKNLADQKSAIEKIIAASKYLPPQARIDLTLKLEKMMGEDTSQEPMLTQQMIKNLSLAGIEIGGHTITHPILTSLDNAAALHEIAGGKQALEAITGQPVRLFAYPNGKLGMDFDERHAQMVRDAGFSAAFTTSMGAATKQNDLFQLPRSRPWDTTPTRFGFRLLRWLAGK